ncbi:MAG: GGDEF domain-containing protein [candidate division WOR-3 bacterium]
MTEDLKRIIPELFKTEKYLTVKEREVLFKSLNKTAEFLSKARIIPCINNLVTWYLTFCYLLHQGIRNPRIEVLFNAHDRIVKMVPEEISSMNKLQVDNSKVLSLIKNRINALILEIESIIKDTEIKLNKVISEISGREKLDYKEILRIQSVLESAQEQIVKRLKDVVGLIETVCPGTTPQSFEPIFCINRNIFNNLVRKAIFMKRKKEEPFTLMALKIKDYAEFENDISSEELNKLLNAISTTLKDELRSYDAMSYENGKFLILLPNCKIKDAVNIAKRLSNALRLVSAEKINYSFAIVEISKEDEIATIFQKLEKVLLLCDIAEGDAIRTELDLSVWGEVE